MFSPSQNGAAPPASVRTSRRRQRPSSNDGSIAEPKPKRQRSALSDQTFLPPGDAPEMEETKKFRTATLTRNESVREVLAPQREMVVRGKKSRSADRGNKGDGSTLLTTNDTYTVSKLPALPDRLRADVAARQHGAVYSDSGYALTLTRTHAIVWPYAVNTSSPETFAFELPHPSKQTSDPLPIGTLVSASASSSDPGLVVVIPSGARITYWESISSAATLDLRLQRNGVETTIQGMYSGEKVTQILNAESAGFVLTFSTGRVAYMSVRDGQGRPAISVQFLRGGSGSVGGGIFGSLRNALSSSVPRGDIAAARAGPQEKVGERNVVVATAKGKIQSWHMNRGGHTSLNAESEAREAIVMAIKEAAPAMSDLLLESFELLDFTHTPKSGDVRAIGEDDNEAHLLLLTSLTDRHLAHYFLIEIVLKRDEMGIGNIRTIKSYTSPISRLAASKPRLYLPKPAMVAYVVFDRAVVVLSMARQPNSPELQLRSNNQILPQSFEDVVDFREDLNIEIVGSGSEEPHGPSHSIEDTKSPRHKAKYPAVVLLVRGGGVVRIAATNLTKLTSNKAQQLNAKSKLEQAVFFGNMDQNPLSFAVRPELQFSPEEVADAALKLSEEILRSEIPHISSVPSSVNGNLEKRSAALRHLAEYLSSSGVALSRKTKWKLLWDAEKMRAAVVIWKRYDATLAEKAPGEKRGLIAEVVDFIHEDYKNNPVEEAGELDRVRHWFIKDVWNIQLAIPWAYQVIKYTYQDGQKDHKSVMNIMSEADDLVLGALKGAFDFRTSNLALYGLGSEELEHGILKAGYEGLPEPWTSIIYITENLRKQVQLAGALLKEYWGKEPQEGKPSYEVVNKIREEYPTLIDVFIRSCNERARWDFAQDTPMNQIEGEQVDVLQATVQEEQITLLATDLELVDSAIELAQKHQLLSTLARLFIYEIEFNRQEFRRYSRDKGELGQYTDRIDYIHSQVSDCFTKFGTAWATAIFQYEIDIGLMSELLDEYPGEQEYLTNYLRSRPEYAEISWINDVTAEKDFIQASRTLIGLGMDREMDLWSKKVELSLGKLALLAGENFSQADGGQAELAPVHDQLSLLKIQDQTYDVVLSTFHNAIDEKAEFQLALEAYGNKDLQNQPSFTSFLAQNMLHLIKHDAMDALELIDLLTLMGVWEEEGFGCVQFYMALQSTLCGLPKDEQLLTQRIIWRRCMLRDDWAAMNDTEQMNDDMVTEQLRRTCLYQTLRLCLKNRFFEEKSTMKPMGPEDVLGAGTDELDHRFTGLDASIRENIMKDMQAEDELLTPLIETHRLGKWYEEALQRAKEDVEEEVNYENDDGIEMANAEDRLRQLEEAVRESEMQKGENRLHSIPRFKANGSLGGFRSSIKQY